MPPHWSAQPPRPPRRSQQRGQLFRLGQLRPSPPRPRQPGLNPSRSSLKRPVPSRRRRFGHRSAPRRTCRPELRRRPKPSPPGRWTPCPGGGTFRQPRPRRRWLRRGPCPSPKLSSRVPASPNPLSPWPRSRPALHRPRRDSLPRPRRNLPGGRGAVPRQRPRPKRPHRVVSCLWRSSQAQRRSAQCRPGSRAAVERVRPPRRRRAAPPRLRPPSVNSPPAARRAGPAVLPRPQLPCPRLPSPHPKRRLEPPRREQRLGRRASQNPPSRLPPVVGRPVWEKGRRERGRPPLLPNPAALRRRRVLRPKPPRPGQARPRLLRRARLRQDRPRLGAAARPLPGRPPVPGPARRLDPERGLAQAARARRPAGVARPRVRARRQATRAGAACVPWPSTCVAWTDVSSAT